jgi:hypothetical protein
LKTIKITTLLIDGEHFSVTPETLSEYAPEYLHEWDFTVRPLRVGDLLKVDAALNQRPGMFRADGRGNVEGLLLARAEELLTLLVTAWNVVDADGAKVEITQSSVSKLPPDVAIELYQKAQRPALPTPEELEARKPLLPKK